MHEVEAEHIWCKDCGAQISDEGGILQGRISGGPLRAVQINPDCLFRNSNDGRKFNPGSSSTSSPGLACSVSTFLALTGVSRLSLKTSHLVEFQKPTM